MKKLSKLFVLFVAVCTALSSCKKDDDENNSTKIIGKWTVKKEIEKIYHNNQLRTTDEEDGKSGAYIEFKSNGTVVWNTDASEPEVYSYKVEGNKLIITEEEDDQDEYLIEELSSSRLIISDEYSETSGGQTVKEVFQLVLEK